MQPHQLKVGTTVYMPLSYVPNRNKPNDMKGKILKIERRCYGLHKFAKVKWSNGKIEWLIVKNIRLTPPSLGNFHTPFKQPKKNKMHYTPIEQRIITLLSDGLPHDRSELFKCLQDKLATFNALAAAIMRLRPKVRELNQEIVTEYHRGSIAYRQVILLSGKELEQEVS